MTSRDHETKREQMRAGHQAAMDTLEAKLRDDLNRQGGDHEMRHKDLLHQIQLAKETLGTSSRTIFPDMQETRTRNTNSIPLRSSLQSMLSSRS